MATPVTPVVASDPLGRESGAPRPPRAGRMIWITAAWGACFVAIEWGLRDAPVLWYAALRALLAGAALVALGATQRRPAPAAARDWAWITVLGLVNVTVAFAAMFAGVDTGATGTAAVFANAQPLLILVPAWWLYGEKLSARTSAALGLGFIGLVLVAVPGGGGSGAVLSLVSAAAVTAGTLLSRRLRGVDVVVFTGWHLLVGGAALAVVAAVAEGPAVIVWTPRFVLALLFLALVGTAATTVAWFAEARRSRLTDLARNTGDDFDAFRDAWSHPRMHAVFTAHPTFLLSPAQSEAVAEGALTGSAPSPDDAEEAPEITLQYEHERAMAAMAHAQDARDRIVAAVLEAAGCVDRYHAIVARSAVLGRATVRQRAVADAILGGLDAVIERVRPGITSHEADAACRGVIEAAGFGEGFAHRTAYGVGIGFPPNWSEGKSLALRPNDATVLKPGMTFHCVPTVFLEEFGMCFSETVLVTEAGCEVLTDMPRKLHELDA